jgi:hypothetical protein
MYTAGGEMVCDNTRRDGQSMVVREACDNKKVPLGYTI